MPCLSVRVPILFNPTAGRGQARRWLSKALEVLRHHGVDPEVRESRNAQHLLDLARQAREERPDLVVSAGGDGTHHFVLNGLAGSDIPLGVLPLGSGNDLAEGLKIPREPQAAARVLLERRVRSIDLARAGSAYYACIGGVGFDSIVARYASERVRWVHGSPAYAWAILCCLGSYRPQPIELRSATQNFTGEIMFAVIGNGVSYGGGLKMTPRARLDDGLLDVCIVPAMGKLELLRWVPRAYRGEHLRHPRIVYFQTPWVSLASPARLDLVGDGEFLQELPARIEAVSQALRVVVPKSGA